MPRRFNAALSEEAYASLRSLNEVYGFSNNYLLTFLLENLDEVVRPGALEKMYLAKAEEFGRPS